MTLTVLNSSSFNTGFFKGGHLSGSSGFLPFLERILKKIEHSTLLGKNPSDSGDYFFLKISVSTTNPNKMCHAKDCNSSIIESSLITHYLYLESQLNVTWQ